MKVFVSSTFCDLVDHRIAVANALDRLGLQVSRMETFGARPQEPVEACSDEVVQSELFVGIYAHRYGYVPQGSSASITELEFEHAHAQRRPTFCYFLDDFYPWPDELRDPQPAKSRLEAFKARVATLVVRGVFTTPADLALNVAVSLSRFLIADPRRHGVLRLADFARMTLADTATALFVDVMRLTCVAADDAARAVNAGSYSEFVDMADLHFRDFFMYVSRLTADSDLDVIQKADAVTRSLGSALVRLKAGPRLDRPWRHFAMELYSAAERVLALVTTAAPQYYEERSVDVAPVIAKAISKHADAKSPTEFVQARFGTQNAVIRHLRQPGVRYDVDRRLAIPYFLIDLTLLRNVVADGRVVP